MHNSSVWISFSFNVIQLKVVFSAIFCNMKRLNLEGGGVKILNDRIKGVAKGIFE